MRRQQGDSFCSRNGGSGQKREVEKAWMAGRLATSNKKIIEAFLG